MVMQDLEPKSKVTSDPALGEVQFQVSGFWTLDQMESLLRGLTKAALPIVEQGRAIHVLGDMTDFVAQSRETGAAIQDHLNMSQKYNLTRVAIMGASSLVKLQYKRLSAGIEVEFFESRTDALQWLRRPESKAA